MAQMESVSTSGDRLDPIRAIQFSKDALTYGFTFFYKTGNGLIILTVLYAVSYFFLENSLKQNPDNWQIEAVSFFIMSSITLAGYQVCLKVYEQGKGGIKDVLKILPRFKAILGACFILFLLYSMAPYLALIFLYRLYPFFIIILDKNYSVPVALTHCWQITSGKFIPMFLLISLMGILIMLGELTFGVGLLVSFPVSLLATTHAYKQLDLHYEASG